MSRRMDRVNVLLRQKLSEIIAHEMRDPRLTPIITVTYVEVSPDLSQAKVFTSTMGTPQEGKDAMDALRAASGFLRRELRTRLTLRTVPLLKFVADDSIVRGQQLLQRIQEIRSQDLSEEV